MKFSGKKIGRGIVLNSNVKVLALAVIEVFGSSIVSWGTGGSVNHPQILVEMPENKTLISSMIFYIIIVSLSVYLFI